MNFETLRNTYNTFIYHNYSICENEDTIDFEFHFEIQNLCEFYPKISIKKKDFIFNNLNSNLLKNIVFNLGMVEAISYFKATCSHNFLIKCGKLDEYQSKWFKKLYYLGLGEFRFINNIKIEEDEFVDFISEGNKIIIENKSYDLKGIVIPVGGGKDSNVTLNLLKEYIKDSVAFRIGSNEVALKCANIAGFNDDKIVEVKRTIDKKLLELNQKGFLNGHTPFSAIVAFLTYAVSFMLEKKYIALSNEDSANESNVNNEKINHQYSKTIEFENDFREYANRYFCTGVEYFSLLRPITELQIAMLFSKLEEYHIVFKSCNVGSKVEPWKWCCNCPKCLFVYSILSPFLYKEKLVKIFGEDLFERKDLLKTFVELCGYGETKPFECVGTYKEIRFAISETIRNNKDNLPYLLQYYKENYELTNENLLKYYNENNNLPKEFEKILKNKLGL